MNELSASDHRLLRALQEDLSISQIEKISRLLGVELGYFIKVAIWCNAVVSNPIKFNHINNHAAFWIGNGG